MCIQNIASEQFSTETSNHVIISIYNRMQLHGHVFEKYQPVGFLTVGFFFCVSDHIPWEPEVFLACGGNFRCWPKADTGEATSGEAARKTSGTERCFLPSPLTFELFYRITFTLIRLKVSDCDHVGWHVKKCPKTHIILRKTSSSLKFIAFRAIMTDSHRNSPKLM